MSSLPIDWLRFVQPQAGTIPAGVAIRPPIRNPGWERSAQMTASAEDDRDIRTSLNGDGEAYARLVRRHQVDITRYMWRFTRDRAVCEELVQDVFVQAYFALPGFKGRSPLPVWLKTIGTRVGYRYWKQRRRQRMTASISSADLSQTLTAPNTESTASQAADWVDAILSRLQPRDRLVLTLMYVEGHHVGEIAALTGWSRTMVKVQAFRARRRLKRILERQEQ